MFGTLFQLSPQDYAVQMLERIFGDAVPFVIAGGTVTGGTWLVDLIAIFNQAMLLIALVIGSYTAYTMLFDTTADGRVFGNTADTKYTILRTLIGAIAFVPVSGGFTFGQIILIWLTVQGSALGDVAWRTVATNSLSSEQILASNVPLGERDFLVRGQFANAMYALTAGELCQLELNNIAANANQTNTTPIQRVVLAPGTTTITNVNTGFLISRVVQMNYDERQIYWQDAAGSYGSADNLCGSVHWDETYNAAGASGSANFATQVGALLIQARFAATNDAVFNELLPAASSIAQTISSGGRDDAAIRTAFENAVDAAFTTYMAGAGTIPGGQFSTLNSSLLTELDQLGWALALNWHRGITMAAVQSRASQAELEITSNPVQNAQTYFQGLGAWWNGRSSGVNRSMFSQLDSNFAYLAQFEAFAVELGMPGQTAVTTAMNGGNANTESILDSLYQGILGWFSAGGPSATYVDPMADLAGMGKMLMGIGGGFLVADTVAPIVGGAIGSSAGPLGTVAGATAGATVGGALLGTVGWLLLGAGFFLLSILPAIPLVYFFSAVISWLALVIESMFAIPLAVLAYFAPARESALIGPWNKMMLNLFGILLRPVFTIIGFIAGLILMRVGLDFLYIIFSGFLSFLASGTGIWGVIVSLGLIFMYIIAALTLVLHTSSLITELGDAAMNWIGIGMSQLGKMGIGSDVERSARGAGPAGTLRQLGSAAGGSARTTQRFLRGKASQAGGGLRGLPSPGKK